MNNKYRNVYCGKVTEESIDKETYIFRECATGIINEFTMSYSNYVTVAYNDDDGYYKKYRTPETEQEAMFIIKANAPINTEAHSNVQTQLNSGKLKFLIEERVAKTKLLETKVGQNMTPEQRAERLRPFQLTDILKEEMLNLREENEGVNIILKQANKRVKKDKFSALEYGLYYIKQEESRKKKKKRFDASQWLFMN